MYAIRMNAIIRAFLNGPPFLWVAQCDNGLRTTKCKFIQSLYLAIDRVFMIVYECTQGFPVQRTFTLHYSQYDVFSMSQLGYAYKDKHVRNNPKILIFSNFYLRSDMFSISNTHSLI